MVDMIKHQILPAVSGYATALSERAGAKTAIGAACKYETVTAKKISDLTDNLLEAEEKLEKDLGKIPDDSRKAMDFTHKTIITDMAAARKFADELESLTAKNCWPFPVYSDLLFYI